MKSRIGLYYPFIHFPNDDWVKLAALYWTRMARIVPDGYPTRDSETVQALGKFIHNEPPRYTAIGQRLATVVLENQGTLRKRYGVDKAHEWKADPVTAERVRAAGTDPGPRPPGVAYIHRAKLRPELREQLIDAGLALPTRSGRPDWIGVHPRVAQVYITALAEEMASDKLTPVSDDPFNHVAISGWTVERLAAVLLQQDGMHSPGDAKHEAETAIAFIAIDTAIPSDLSKVPIDRILEFRRDHRSACLRFQAAVEQATSNLVAAEFESSTQWRTHIEAVYEDEIRRKVDQLHDDFSWLGVKSVRGLMDMKVVAPELLTASLVAADVAVNPAVITSTGIAVGLARVGHEYQSEKRKLLRADMAYLYLLEKELMPGSLMQRIKYRLKKFLPARRS